MSIFVKVEANNELINLLEFRGLFGVLGETKFGTISNKKVENQYFELVNYKSYTYLKCLTNHLFLGEKELFFNEQVMVNSGDILKKDDNYMLIHITNEFAEVNRNKLNSKNESSYKLIVKVGNLEKTFTLCKGCEYTLGSSNDDDIFINFFDIKENHLSIKANEKTLSLKPKNGQVKVLNKLINKNRILRKNTKISLLPYGLEVNAILN